MKNVIKGWVTTIAGLIIMIVDGLYFFGFIKLPNPDALNDPSEVAIAFGVGLTLFLVPETWIEEQLKRFISNKNEPSK